MLRTFILVFISFFICCPSYCGLLDEDCFVIASPSDFYFNTVLLSWTPVDEADHYEFEYQVGNQGGTIFLNQN